jgi:hypothetical protein
MGVWLRGWFAFASTVAVAVAGLVYARVGTLIIDMGLNGDMGGPFNPILERVQTVVPILLSAILVGVAVYLLVGGVQRERSVDRRPPRR